MTAREEVLETIRLWIVAEEYKACGFENGYPEFANGIRVAVLDLEELLDSL